MSVSLRGDGGCDLHADLPCSFGGGEIPKNTTVGCLSARRAPLDALSALGAGNQAVYIDAWRMDLIRIQGSFGELLDFGDRAAGSSRHHRVEVAGGFAELEVAEAVGSVGVDQGEVRGERRFEDVGFAVEVAGFLAVGGEGAGLGGGVEGRDAGTAGADAFGEGALGGKS